MKQRSAALLCLALAAALLSGCSAGDPGREESGAMESSVAGEISEASETESSESDESSFIASSEASTAESSEWSSDESSEANPIESGETQEGFTPGAWRSDAGQYYFFDEDGAAGRTANFENGMGVGFAYTVDGARAVFSMGGADNEQGCAVTWGDGSAVLAWDNGQTETLTFVSPLGSDAFTFYTDEELCELALAYTLAQNGGQAGNLEAASQANADGSVSIQVYENLGDHNSTAAWYTVDRETAAGTDGTGAPVSLAG